jgi:serine/threonine protein kinase
MSKARKTSPSSQQPPTRVERPAAQAFGGFSKTNPDPFIGKSLPGEGEHSYRIEGKIGAGGMAKVYLATDSADGSKVAVKFLHSQFNVMEDDVKKRFLKEAEALCRVSHMNVVEVKHVGHFGGELFVAMEFLEGKDLSKIFKQLFKKNKKIDWKLAKPMLLQICDALEAVHRERIIHRDLKPSNIVIMKKQNGMVVKVLDFGLAKFTKEGDEDSYQTKTGMFVGTPTYTSPEQASGKKEYDHRVDIYALGVIMYEMLCGQVPFKGENHFETFKQHVEMLPLRPSIKNPKAVIAPEIEKIVMKALEKNPNDRFGSMAEMRDAIDKDGRVDSMNEFAFGDALGTKGISLPKPEDISEMKNAGYSYTETGLGMDLEQLSPPPAPRKRRGWGKTIVTLGLLAGLAVTGYHFRDYISEQVQRLFHAAREVDFSSDASARSETRAPYQVTVKTNPRGASVFIQERMGTRTVERRLGRAHRGFSSVLPPGGHKLVLRKRGYRTVTVDVTVENSVVDVSLPRL